jgi:hypothetical protein
MDKKYDYVTWMQNKGDVITLVNKSTRNFILEIPTGRLRLDAGRSVRTMASLASEPRIKELVAKGELAVER